MGLAALVKEFEERMYETSTQADARLKLAAAFAGKKKPGIHCVFRNYQCRRQQRKEKFIVRPDTCLSGQFKVLDQILTLLPVKR